MSDEFSQNGVEGEVVTQSTVSEKGAVTTRRKV